MTDTIVLEAFIPDTIVLEAFIPDTIVLEAFIPDTIVLEAFILYKYIFVYSWDTTTYLITFLCSQRSTSEYYW